MSTRLSRSSATPAAERKAIAELRTELSALRARCVTGGDIDRLQDYRRA
jgi:hypothetical protein